MLVAKVGPKDKSYFILIFLSILPE